MFAILLIFPILFFSTNKEFFDKVAEDTAKGAEWHHVGPQALDPTAKSLPLQCMTHEVDEESVPCGEPYIIYKLKMPKDD